ncbi:hypothetical protein [Mesorhizobium sp.]|uniref:hypothetical protein n=1 Tax=Mesorhizobium sp. TaxID=1871066 RepID=UPI0025E3E886|nr:hypothetical protein [Mesorhizobium sp.]
MQSITATFTAAARGRCATTGFSFFWMMVFAIAILDDSERRSEQRCKRNQSPRPPNGHTP